MTTEKPTASDADLLKPLTPRQKIFVETYLKNGRNVSAAYKATRPAAETAHMVPKRVWRNAKLMLRSRAITKVLAVLNKRENEMTLRVLDRHLISEERIKEELAKIAFSDVKNTVEWGPDGVIVKDSKDLNPDVTGAVAEVSESVSKDGRVSVKLKNYDKRQALVDLGKAIGMFKEQQPNQIMVAAKLIIEK